MCRLHDDGIKNTKAMIIFATTKKLWDKQKYYALPLSFIYLFPTYDSPLKISWLHSILAKHMLNLSDTSDM